MGEKELEEFTSRFKIQSGNLDSEADHLTKNFTESIIEHFKEDNNN